jgi:hypothetical protein
MHGQYPAPPSGRKVCNSQKVPHQWWNESEDTTVHTRFLITPAYNFEIAQEQIFGIFNINIKGKRPFLQII